MKHLIEQQIAATAPNASAGSPAFGTSFKGTGS
ncbi:Uncharacterised protein [Hungatella hathewayi]|nr:Uncharacterised protein [Hungatella hathewayi]